MKNPKTTDRKREQHDIFQPSSSRAARSSIPIRAASVTSRYTQSRGEFNACNSGARPYRHYATIRRPRAHRRRRNFAGRARPRLIWRLPSLSLSLFCSSALRVRLTEFPRERMSERLLSSLSRARDILFFSMTRARFSAAGAAV